MKKIILLSTLLAASLFAKNGFVDIGGGYLGQEIKGDLTVESSIPGIAEYKVTDPGTETDSFYGYVDIHDLPIIPNIKIDFQNPDFESTNLKSTYSTVIGGQTTDSQGNYSLETTQIGAYGYYDVTKFIPNFSLNLGLGVKYIDYDLYVKDNGTNSVIYSDSDSVVVPLVYVKPELQISNWTAYVEGKGISYDGDSFYEVKAGGSYFFDLSIGRLGVEGGYYYSKLKSSDDSSLFNNTKLDFKSNGFYAGLIYNF